MSTGGTIIFLAVVGGGGFLLYQYAKNKSAANNSAESAYSGPQGMSGLSPAALSNFIATPGDNSDIAGATGSDPNVVYVANSPGSSAIGQDAFSGDDSNSGS